MSSAPQNHQTPASGQTGMQGAAQRTSDGSTRLGGGDATPTTTTTTTTTTPTSPSDHGDHHRLRTRMADLLRRYRAARPHTATQAETAQDDARSRRIHEARAAARRAEMRLARVDMLARRQQIELNGVSEWHQAADLLDQVNEDIRSLLDEPLSAGATTPASQDQGSDDGTARHKRRRLDGDMSEREQPFVDYGHYGQVVPGALAMQILSCDGGTLDSHHPTHPSRSRALTQIFAVENILRDDDDSVFCTQKPRCNLILKHKGETTFDLERLVIKAPPRQRYTDPVQDGLMFVAMDKEDPKFDKTVQYEVHYLPASRFAQYFPSVGTEPQFTGVEYAGSGERTCHASATKLPPIASASTVIYVEPSPARTESTSTLDSNDWDAYFRRETEVVSTNLDIAALQDTIRRRRGIAAERQATERRGLFDELMRQHDNSESFRHWRDSGEELRDGQNPLEYHATLTGYPELDSSTRLPIVSSSSISDDRITRLPSVNPSTTTTDSSSFPRTTSIPPTTTSITTVSTEHDATPCPSADNYLVPKARFSMHPGNDTMEIKFNPPVSCKYILLKLWSQRHDGNIDVQSVTAYGFAGVRWFPAVEVR